jgi:glycerophosphoryl diester phosphodiesterase
MRIRVGVISSGEQHRLHRQTMQRQAKDALSFPARINHRPITPNVELEIRRRTLKIELPLLTPAFVRKAQDDGFKVHAWAINDAKEMKSIKDLGVDGIITDYPSRLLSVP